MKSNIILILVAFSASFINSCKPERVKSVEDFGIFYFGESADYFDFKVGSYWIYENNRTGEIDTNGLIYYYRDTTQFTYENWEKKKIYSRELIDFTIVTTNRRQFVNYNTSRPCLECTSFNPNILSVLKYDWNSVFRKPWDIYPGVSRYYPSLTILNNTYNDVLAFDIENDSSLPFWDDSKLHWGGQNGAAKYSTYYWAKGVGLVQIKYKKTIDTGPDSAYWSLKEYHLEKK
jgi:hypothetical protein